MQGPGDPDDAVINCLSTQIEGEGFVTGFVLVATYTDSDGDTRIWTDTMRDQRCHSTLGLLSWALAVEQARAQDMWRDDEDG